MKQCPSCHHDVHERLVVCPHCGYDFDQAQQEVKKTMMGIPSGELMSELRALRQQEQAKPAPVSQTMFGFPALGGSPPTSAAQEEDDEEEDFGPTQVIAAADVPELGGVGEPTFNPRSTAPGGFPSLASLRSPPSSAPASAPDNPRSTMMLGSLGLLRPPTAPQDDDSDAEEAEEADFGATMVVSPSHSIAIVDEPTRGDVSGFSRQGGGADYSKDRQHATLTGLHIGDLIAGGQPRQARASAQQPQDPRQTMFSLPTPIHDERDSLFNLSDAHDSEPEEVEASLSTQALASNMVGDLLDEVRAGQQRDDHRRRLLDKLKQTQREEPAQEDSTRTTMFGIPGISRQSGEPLIEAEDGFGTKPAPSGVVRVGKRRVTQETEGIDPLGATNVVSPSSLKAALAHTATSEPPQLNRSTPPISFAPAPRPSPDDSAISSDDLFGSTAIADAALLRSVAQERGASGDPQTAVASAELLSALAPALNPSLDESSEPEHATAVASLEQLGRLTEHEGSTRVQDASILAQLGTPKGTGSPSLDDLISAMNSPADEPKAPALRDRAPTPALTPALAPTLTPAPPVVHERPRAAHDLLASSGPQHPMPTPARPITTPLPPEPLPAPRPAPLVEQAVATPAPPQLQEPRAQAPQAQAPQALPQTTTQPPSTSLATAPAPASDSAKLVRGIQLGFTGLGALASWAAVGLTFATQPPSGAGLVVAAAPALVGILGLAGAFLPGMARKLALLASGTLGLVLVALFFAVLSAPLTGLIAVSAGALLLLAAGVFSFLA